MTRKSKQVMARILAVVMAAALVPSNMWGTAGMVMAEETSEVFVAEETDVTAEDVQETQEEDAPAAADEAEESAPVDVDEEEDSAPADAAEDDKNVEVTEEKKDTENVSAETDNKATVEHVHNFTKDGFGSDSFFTISGNKQGNPVSFNYTDKSGTVLTLNAALKMESSTSISFNAAQAGELVLVHPTDFTKGTNVDGEKKTATSGIIEVKLEAGSHTVTKGDKTDLYYIAFIPEGADKPSVADPTATSTDTEVKIGDTITLSCATEDAVIYYTTDGSDPKNNASKKTYSDGIPVTVDMVTDGTITIMAYASKTDHIDSETKSFIYHVSTTPGENQVQTPTAEPEMGEVPRGTEVTLKSEDGASIYYTVDGTNPNTSSTRKLFTETAPIIINEETVIKAVAEKTGKDNSFTASFTYTIKKPTIGIDPSSTSIIRSIESEGDMIFINQDKEEVFNIKVKAEKVTTPDFAIKTEAEKLTKNGEILYYEFTLVNAENINDVVKIAEGTTGKLKIKMPYSIAMQAANKRNEIFVLHNTTSVEVTNETDGFSFIADSFSPYTVIINPMGEMETISITESGGYEEGAYAEWEAVENADGYMAYIAPAGGKFERIANELVREYNDYWRVDTVGLAQGIYYIKVNAVVLGEDENGDSTATVIATKITKALRVSNYDRSGFAFSRDSKFKTGSGAYNDNGTLREGAQIIYVTAETAGKVTLDVITDSKGGKTTCIGIQSILDARQKGYDKTPLDIRVIGCVSRSNLDHISSDSEGLQIKGKGNYEEMNITIEGIGEDAVIKDFGFLIRNCGNVELRNFGVLNFMDDGVSIDSNNCNIWVHDLDIFYGATGSDSDQAKGDGSVDIKGKSEYITVAYNHFWDSGKCSLCGMDDSEEFTATYHHNWFDHSDSRHPRIRVGSIHVYNNYFDGNSKYGVGVTNGSSAFVEANYFRNCKYPMLISQQGSDIADNPKGTFSGEEGGIIKAYDNAISGAKGLIYANAANGSTEANAIAFDAYLASNRNEQVSDTYKTVKGGKSYNNFDTQYDLGVTEDNIDIPENVPAVVAAKAGRLNGGDLKWEFNDTVEDTNYAVVSELKTRVVNYKTSVVKVGGRIEGKPIVLQDNLLNVPSGGSQIVEKPMANKPSGKVAVGTAIELSCPTADAKIYYTLTGLAPTEKDNLYNAPIIINNDTTIKAIAILETSESDVSIFKYTIPGSNPNPGGDADINHPTAVPASGNIKKGESVQLSAAGEIYYTMTIDGSDPAEPTTDSEKYGTGIKMTAEAGTTVKIKAIAVVDGKPSQSASFTYTIVEDIPDIKEPLSKPETSLVPAEGATYPVGVKIGLTSKEGGTIYYTLDGTEPKKEDGQPSETSKALAENELITLDAVRTYTVKAFAVKEGYLPSDTVTFTYTVSENATQTQLAQPVITPASKNVEKGEQITVTITKAESDPEDTEIYYTTDGSAPTKTNGHRFNEPFMLTVDETTIITAVAIKEGAISSPTASVAYTVKSDDTPNPPAGVGLRVVLKNPNEVYTYTGSTIKPDIIVWNNSDRLVEGVDYTVKYKNNINASAADTKENKKPQIIVTGKGNLTGKASTTFEINAKQLDNDVAVAGVEKDSELGNMFLVVENTKPAPSLYYGGAKLTKKDYTVSVTDKCVASDTGKNISITGTGNFAGTLTYKLKVIAKDQLKKFSLTFTAPNYTYNGSSQKLTLAESDVKDISKTDTDGQNLKMGTDYTIVYQNDTINAGKVKFTVAGLGYYTGAVSKTYTIKPLAVESGFGYTGVEATYPYAGTSVTVPTAGITYNGAALEEGKDYKLTYGNNKKVGTAKIAVSFMGNYKGSRMEPKTFEITPGMLNNQTAGLKIAIADKVYNKPGVYKSAPYVSVNGVEVKASEYTVKYYTKGEVKEDGGIVIDSNTEMGSKNKIELSETESNKTVYVEITGKGKNYAAGMKLTASYQVYKASGNAVDLSKAKLTVYKDWNVSDTADKASKGNKMEYTGVEIKPGVMIELKDANKTTLSPKQVKELIDAKKITVQYTNNINKGKAAIVINGNGTDYVGGKAVTFSITTKSLKDTDILVNLFKDVNKIIKG